MRNSFDFEASRLLEEAAEFARQYPERAGQLNLLEVKDRDPYVERLLQGMAFLCAQLHHRIQDDIPEISESLIHHLWPQMLRPFPSATIIEFRPRAGQLPQSTTVPKGTQLMSAPVGPQKVPCRFRTTAELSVHPMHLESVNCQTRPEGGATLKMGFSFDKTPAADAIELRTLRLYLHADPATSMRLFHALCAEVQKVELSTGEESLAISLGDQSAVSPCHMGPQDSLAPQPNRSFAGYHLLHEYFCFREKYQFIEIGGFEKVQWAPGCSGFELKISLKSAFVPSLTIKKENFRQHCVPAINLAESESEPIYLNHRRNTYNVVPNASAPEAHSIYSVNRVSGVDAQTGQRNEYQPLEASSPENSARRCYWCHTRRNEKGAETTTLSVGGDLSYRREVLSCAITVSNGFAAREFLAENDIRIPSPQVPSFLQFSNLIRPSRPLSVPTDRDFRMKLIALLSLNSRTIDSAEALQQCLKLFEWSDNAQNQRRIAGIADMRIDPVNQVVKGALLRGLEVRLTLREEHFLSPSDAFQFAQLLHRFLSLLGNLNTFVRTRFTLQPSQETFLWGPSLGTNSPI